MATRKKETTPPGLKGAASEIWLAGLGAYSIAGEEGGKLFKHLVGRGRVQKEANKEMVENFTERAQGLKENAKEALGRLAVPIEDGLASAMQRLGVPTRQEILKLTHRVEELTKRVGKVKTAEPAKPKAAAPKAKAKTAKPRAKAETAAATGA